jgi:hypothetical protein
MTPESMTSPHSRHRHPETDSQLAASFILIAIIKP